MEHPWFLITDQVPNSDELVEIRYEVDFRGRYMPGCKLSEWIAEDGEPLSYKPVAWRCVEEKENGK